MNKNIPKPAATLTLHGHKNFRKCGIGLQFSYMYMNTEDTQFFFGNIGRKLLVIRARMLAITQKTTEWENSFFYIN